MNDTNSAEDDSQPYRLKGRGSRRTSSLLAILQTDAWSQLPRTWSRRDATVLVDDLTRIWHAQSGDPPQDLNHDIAVLDNYFNPLAAGSRLRALLVELPPVSTRSEAPRDPFILSIGDGRYLVTPDGRLLLELLVEKLGQYEQSFAMSQADWREAQSRLLSLYRAWSQQKLRDVIALQTADGAAPMLPQTIGIVLFLLVNGNIGIRRAFRRPADHTDFTSIDRLTQDVVAEFADNISTGRSRRKDQFSLYGGYALTEARRRLGARRLVVDGPKIYIFSEGVIDEIIERIARDLLRREVSPLAAKTAFDSLVKKYRQIRPQLAAFRLAFEQPASTEAIRERLMEAIGEHGRGTP